MYFGEMQHPSGDFACQFNFSQAICAGILIFGAENHAFIPTIDTCRIHVR